MPSRRTTKQQALALHSDPEKLREKQKIIHYFIRNAPPDELNLVLEDCELIVEQADVLSPSLVESYIRDHREDVCTPVTVGSSENNGLICLVGRCGGEYLLPQTKELFQIEGKTLRLLGEPHLAPSNLFPQAVENYRKSLENMIRVHVKNFYINSRQFSSGQIRKGLSTRFGWAVYSLIKKNPINETDGGGGIDGASHDKDVREKSILIGEDTQASDSTKLSDNCDSASAGSPAVPLEEYSIVAIISVTNSSLRNFWCGRWISRWEISFSPSDRNAPLMGLIRAEARYFEDGNILLNVDDSLPPSTVSVSDPKTFAVEVASEIHRAETGVFARLEDFYASYVRDVLQHSRRLLPKSRKRFAWDEMEQTIQSDILRQTLLLKYDHLNPRPNNSDDESSLSSITVKSNVEH